jgi:hypothetical protein
MTGEAGLSLTRRFTGAYVEAPMFDWMITPPRKHNNHKRDDMYKRELEERAALLFRLGYAAKRAKARLHANVAWDFELHGRPRHAADVDKIVDAVYRRGGRAGGTPSV